MNKEKGQLMKPKTFLTVLKTNKSKSWCFKRTNKIEIPPKFNQRRKKEGIQIRNKERGHNYIAGV